MYSPREIDWQPAVDQLYTCQRGKGSRLDVELFGWRGNSSRVLPSYEERKYLQLERALLGWRKDALGVQELLYNCMYELYRDVHSMMDLHRSFVQKASRAFTEWSLDLRTRVDLKMKQVSRSTRDQYQCPDDAPAFSTAALYLLCVVKQQFNTIVDGMRNMESERQSIAKVCTVHVRSDEVHDGFVHNGRTWDDLNVKDLHSERQVDVQGLEGFVQMMRSEGSTSKTHTSQVVRIGGQERPYSYYVRGDEMLTLSAEQRRDMPNSGVIMACRRKIEILQDSLLHIFDRVVVV